MTSPQPAKDEYQTALYKAAARAASILEAALDPNKTSYDQMEPEKINISLKLLAIVQGAPSPDKFR